MDLARSRSTRAAIVLILFTLLSTPVPARADSGQFLLISDIHFNPFYDGSLFDQLQSQPVERWAGILGKSEPTQLNPRGTDSNYTLLKSALDDARARIPEPDFVLYPGDLMAHQWQAKYDALAKQTHLADPEAYRAFTAKAIRFLAGEFRRRYPQASILPTLGNDDSYCGDYMIGPDGPFLAMFAEAWAPLIGSGEAQNSFRKTFSRGGYYSLSLPHPIDHRLIVLNSVFFSVNYDDACGPSGRTPSLDQIRWLEETLERAEAAGEAVWLLMHIPPGINSFNSAESLQKGGPPVTFWQPELTGRFLQILRRYPTTIRAAFAGHTHMDDYRVIRLDGQPALFCKIAPAISPVFGNNPGYQVYQYDRGRGTLQNFRTFYLTNLPDDGQPTARVDGKWALEYDFQMAYGFDSVTARSINRLANDLKTDAAAQQHYSKFYGVSAAPEFAPGSFRVYRCAISNVTPAEFLKSMIGVPTPKRPPLFPDRRPTASSTAR
jgi:sphingomyelin phosphodiesterase acid-like 3